MADGGTGSNEHDVEIERHRLRWAFWHRVADAIVNGVTIASAALPIWFLGDKVASPLAGKTTHADIHVGLEVGITLAASLAVNGFQLWKGRERKRTIHEQRDRISQYEGRLGLPPREERDRLARGLDLQ